MARNGNGSLAAPVASLFVERGRLDKTAGLKHRSSGALKFGSVLKPVESFSLPL